MDKNNNSELLFNNNFRKSLVALVIPIALQNLISAAVNSADIIMLGTIDQSAISAVSLAGQVTFIVMLFYFGLAVGTGILTAQYWGKKDMAAISRVLSIACMLSIAVSFVFFIVSISFPASLIRIFTNDTELIKYGVKYQHSISFSYLAMGLSQMYLSMVKSMEKARFCAIISSAALLLNILFNAVCIFVLFPGIPEKAIVGVAISTVIVRIIELVCCIFHSLYKENVRFSLPTFDNMQKQLLHDYLRYTTPALANYIVWGSALAATSAIIGHVSSDMVAANAVTMVVRNLAIVLCGGIAAGGSVLVGKYLGRGDLQSAKKAGNKIYLYALLFGILAGLTVLLIKPLVFSIIDLNTTAHDYLNVMLTVSAVYCIGKSLNSTVIGGIFCAGGDAKFGFWCDTIVMWGLIIPFGYLCAFVWKIPPVFLYIVLCLDEFIKIPVAAFRFRQYRWLKNITRNFG